MRRFIEHLKKVLHMGHVHEIAEHERARIAADVKNEQQKAEERRHLESTEAILRDLSERRPVTNGSH